MTTTFVLCVFAFLIALIGASIGSFLNVVIWRVPEGMSLTTPPSHCPKCGSPVRWFDNVPILSWFVLGGKCRDCKEPISKRYPLVEASSFLVSCIVGASILLGGWSGVPSEVLRWSEYADWTEAFQEFEAATLDKSGEVAERESALSLVDEDAFSSDYFLRLLRVATILAIYWTLVVDLTLMLGLVCWDRGVATKSLIWASLVVLALGGVLGVWIVEPGARGARCVAFASCVLTSACAPCLLARWLSKAELADWATICAVWGVCAGVRLAFIGALILSCCALVVKLRFKRQVLGLATFAAIVVLLAAVNCARAFGF